MGLPRDRRMRRPEEFKQTLSRGRKAGDALLAIAAAHGAGPGPRFGLSVSKRTGGAVQRNRLKRRLKEALRQIGLTGPWSIVVTARPAAADARFDELRQSLRGLLTRLKVNDSLVADPAGGVRESSRRGE
jgi:ribonuclease P protein component